MMISKLACLAPPPFAPIEFEPNVFVLRQVFDREQILLSASKIITKFMIVIILLGWLAGLLSSSWPNASIRVLMLMLFIMPFPLLVVGWMIWTLATFIRYFTEKSRTREVLIELCEDGMYGIMVNDRQVESQLYTSEVSIRRKGWLRNRQERFLAVCFDAGQHVQLVVCTHDERELETWRSRLHVGERLVDSALSVRGVLGSH